MGEQECVRQRADAARHRGDRRGDAPSGLEVDVADEAVTDDVDADVDDDRAAPEHRPRHEAGMAGGHDEDLGVFHVMREVGRPRVADRDRRVLSDEEERRRHPDDGGPADDDRPLALDLDPGSTEDSTAAWAVAGRKPS